MGIPPSFRQIYVNDIEETIERAPADDWGAVSPELAYIHDTLVEAMSTLSDPAS